MNDQQTATLLVVDDNAENRDMLSRRLVRSGYAVISAEDGESALDLLAKQTVDLVLLDVMMPGIDGLEVLRRLREQQSAAELPVIMATARGESDDVIAALDLGANDYVTKPIDFPVVLARVQKELRTRDDRRQQGSEGTLGPGSLVAGRYRLGEIVGKGNFGVVHQAHHIELDMPVAVKLLQTQVAGDDALARFRTEGRTAVRLDHPNAVTVYDFGVTDSGTAYLVMELLAGEPLSQYLRRFVRLEPARANALMQPVCAALAAAHDQGLVHRDVKPENVFLHQSRGGHEVVKVLDFGIAKLVGEHISRENLTAEGYVLGTPAYMSPERLRNHLYDGRSDVYSLGVMLFQLLTGKLPFKPNKEDPMALLMMHLKDEPPKLRSLMPDLSEKLETLILRCMDKDPDRRPTADQLAQVLAALTAHAAPATAAHTAAAQAAEPHAGMAHSQLDDDQATHHLPVEGVPDKAGNRFRLDSEGAEPGHPIGRWWRKLIGG